nr:hypothetical protein [Akkermansiaceae bacterium]
MGGFPVFSFRKHTVKTPALLVLFTAGLATAGPKDFDRLTFHAAPKSLATDATTEDWPRFLGPRHDLHSRETKLLKSWPASGPKVVWEVN